MLLYAWNILCESALFILAGFGIAGLLEMGLSSARVIRLISARRARSVFLATVIGIPLPLCSCSVLPTAVTLRRKGASRGATLSFLISTPETSVTSVLLTYALLGPLMAIYRPIAACITALTAGLLENARDQRADTHGGTSDEGEGTTEDSTTETCSPITEDASGGGDRRRFGAAMRYAFVDLFDDIFGWVVVGILAAAAIKAWVPSDVVGTVLAGPLESYVLMVLISVPLYVCAEASTPIAAALIAQGMNPGAALVFLLVGPATNIGSLGVLHRELGRRTVVLYLVTIVVVAVFMGSVLNSTLAESGVVLAVRAFEEPLVPAWLKTIGAVAFLAIGVGSIRRAGYARRLAAYADARLPVNVTPRRTLVVTIFVAVALYAASGFYAIYPGDVGIVRRFGAVHGPEVLPGLHYALPFPIDDVDKVPVDRVRRLPLGSRPDGLPDEEEAARERDSWHLVGDENIADIVCAAHWSVDPERVVAFQFGVRRPDDLVRNVALGAMREVLGGASINRVFTTNREHCEERITNLAQSRLDEYDCGIRLHSIGILAAHATPEVHAAFRDVASALEDRATAVDKARAMEARIVPQARGEAALRRADASGYAARTVSDARGQADRFLSLMTEYKRSPWVTRLRLEIEAMEEVLPKLDKYIKPTAAEAGEIEIWFVEPEAAEGVATWMQAGAVQRGP
jgi:HflK protein